MRQSPESSLDISISAVCEITCSSSALAMISRIACSTSQFSSTSSMFRSNDLTDMTRYTSFERVLAPVLSYRLVRLISTTRECLLRLTELEDLLADVDSSRPIPKPQPLG